MQRELPTESGEGLSTERPVYKAGRRGRRPLPHSPSTASGPPPSRREASGRRGAVPYRFRFAIFTQGHQLFRQHIAKCGYSRQKSPRTAFLPPFLC